MQMMRRIIIKNKNALIYSVCHSSVASIFLSRLIPRYLHDITHCGGGKRCAQLTLVSWCKPVPAYQRVDSKAI